MAMASIIATESADFSTATAWAGRCPPRSRTALDAQAVGPDGLAACSLPEIEAVFGK